jgi:hypothetical protein
MNKKRLKTKGGITKGYRNIPIGGRDKIEIKL